MAEGAKVLIVEDDPSITRMLRFSMGLSGFEVTEVATGGKALGILASQPVDAVVLDLGLPDNLGGTVLQNLHKPGKVVKRAPVYVVISALDKEEAVRRYGALGDNFLAKPFNPWDLVSLLQKLLSSRDGS